MTQWQLTLRSLTHYWRSNLAVALGVATAVSVLAGALNVGESVRGSLRDLVRQRLGRTDHVLRTAAPVREDLAADLAEAPGFADAFVDACPLVALEGQVAQEGSGRRASGVAVYGVDERFWRFHGQPEHALEGRSVLLSAALAAELGNEEEAPVLLTVQRGSDVPGASLFGQRDQPGRTLRLRVAGRLGPAELGEFSLRPRQGAVRAAFVPLALLQRALDWRGQVDTILVSGRPDPDATDVNVMPLLRSVLRLEDLGLRLRHLEPQAVLSLESRTALIGDDVAGVARETAGRLGLQASGVLTYLANEIRVGERTVPYSLVAGLEPPALAALAGATMSPSGSPALLLNDWAARELEARPGDPVGLDYYLWQEEGRLLTRSTQLELAGIVPLRGAAADPDLTPTYPGISDSLRLGDWDPPFPVDLDRIREQDEEYWSDHRTTPKAFVSLVEAQRLWGHRLGRLTSLRLSGEAGADLASARSELTRQLVAGLDPQALGLQVEPVRERGLRASQGATDFGEYFTYFSFFLVVSALLLTGLFFRIAVEQRLQAVGLLQAVGFSRSAQRRVLLGEAAIVSLAGSLLGVLGAMAYAQAMMLGLRTWWVDAVGTERLALHVSVPALTMGAAGGVLMALLAMAGTLRGLRSRSPRSLIAHAPTDTPLPSRRRRRRTLGVAAASGLLSGLLVVLAASGVIGQVPGFFGSGSCLLIAALCLVWLALSRGIGGLPPNGTRGLVWLGAREASYRPGRSVLCVSLIASATFIIVSVGAFRRGAEPAHRDRHSGTGGYSLLGRSLLPLHNDLATAEGREALGLDDDGEAAVLQGVGVARFRVRAGEDTSCLNLYRPQSPTILAPGAGFVEEGRFVFQGSVASQPEDRDNPWRLLDRDQPDGSLPVIADASSMAYVLHRSLGEELVVEREGQEPLRLRFVAALRDSLFQSELLMGERHFLQAFPHEDGYRQLLLEVPAGREAEVTRVLEERLVDQGLDLIPAAQRLESFHRVENAYLSTFQFLGGLGLLLGTLGLGTVLIRNALERRRELALLRAVGYTARDLTRVVLAENALLLVLGLLSGALSALLAIAPAVASRGGQMPLWELGGLLLAVLVSGLLVSRLAVGFIHRMPLLAGLRAG